MDFDVKSARFQILATLSILACFPLGGCVGPMSGNSYWDAQVDQLCRKDGGITVFEVIELTTKSYESHLQGGELWLPRTLGIDAKRPESLYARYTSKTLQTGNPEVYRSTLSVVRGHDHKVLATRVVYTRNFVRSKPRGDSQVYKHECPNVPDEAFFSQVIKERREP